jgi:hypothetical protein
LAKNGVIISDPTEILSEFSSHFFPAVGLDEPVHTETISFVNTSLESVSDTTAITSSELDSAIGQLKNTSTPGPDGLSAMWLKISYAHFADHLLAILNICMKLGYFPKAWRVASIFILKKPGKLDYLSANDYSGES